MVPSSDHRPLVVVLGATGAIGSAVTGSLAARPIRLRAVSRRGGGPAPLGARAACEVEAVDVTDRRALEAVVDGADAVLHLVPPDGHGSAATLMSALVDVLSPRSGRPATPVVVYAGTITQVGVPPRPLLDGTEIDEPETVLARDKHRAESALLQASDAGAVRGVSVRLPTVYGHDLATGRFDRGVVTAMIRRALAGEELTMWHDGSVERDLLHLEDAGAALVAALDHADALVGRHWLAGTGVGTALGEAFGVIASLVAEQTGTAPVPVVSVAAPQPLSATDSSSTIVDPSAFRDRAGWQAGVGLREGLDRTVAAAIAVSDRVEDRADGVDRDVLRVTRH